jgi:hypothetical protein
LSNQDAAVPDPQLLHCGRGPAADSRPLLLTEPFGSEAEKRGLYRAKVDVGAPWDCPRFPSRASDYGPTGAATLKTSVRVFRTSYYARLCPAKYLSSFVMKYRPKLRPLCIRLRLQLRLSLHLDLNRDLCPDLNLNLKLNLDLSLLRKLFR